MHRGMEGVERLVKNWSNYGDLSAYGFDGHGAGVFLKCQEGKNLEWLGQGLATAGVSLRV
jgi:hypothetical protein